MQEQANIVGQQSTGRAPVTSSALSSGPDIGNPSTVPNQFIVVLKDQSNVDTVYAMANEMISPSGTAASILDVYDSTIKGFTVSVSDQQDFNSLANDPRVAFVEQDRVVYGQQFFSNDPQQYESESLEMLPSKVTGFNQQLQRQVLDPLFPVVPQDQSAPIPSVELPYVHTQQQLQQHPLLPSSILPPQLEQPIFIPQQLNEQPYSTLQQQEQLLQQQQDQGQGQQQQQQQTIPTGVNRVHPSVLSNDDQYPDDPVNVDIALLDTGIDLDHPDLLNVYNQISLVPGTQSADDDNGHGTHVAGIAAARDNNLGVVGIAPGARLWAVKVLDSNGQGLISNIIKGIDYLGQHTSEVDVINMSFGCNNCYSTALDLAIQNLISKGITFVAAAGNGRIDASTFSPANINNVIAVSAIADSDGKCGGIGPSTSFGADDTFASFSNYGSTVSLAAPGVNILSTYIGGGFATVSGTSMSAAHVSGVAGLIKAASSSASAAEVKNTLIQMANKPSSICDQQGRGGYFTGDVDGIAEPLVYVPPIQNDENGNGDNGNPPGNINNICQYLDSQMARLLELLQNSRYNQYYDGSIQQLLDLIQNYKIGLGC
jgi:subtilase family protein/peptidase inhibitor I9